MSISQTAINGVAMPDKVYVVVTDPKRGLAEDFVSLILPRVMENYTLELETIIQNLKAALGVGSKQAGSKTVKKLLAENEARMVKVLSGEPAEKIKKFYVDALVAEFTEEDLRMAVFQEQFTVKFNALAARSEAVFKEALGGV